MSEQYPALDGQGLRSLRKVIRLCLDLNIWCAALLADFKGRQNTSSQRLVQIVHPYLMMDWLNAGNIGNV